MKQYQKEELTSIEAERIIKELKAYSSSDLYESNKSIMKMISDGFILKREDRSKKDIYIQLLDYRELIHFRVPDEGDIPIVAENQPNYAANKNIYRIVNQLEITGYEKRIPDLILYINGLPLVVL